MPETQTEQKRLEEFTVGSSETVRTAFKRMDLNRKKFIAVIDDQSRMIGLITEGDLRRAIWNGVSFESDVSCIMNKNFVSVQDGCIDEKEVKQIFTTTRIHQIPILQDHFFVDMIYKDEFLAKGFKSKNYQLDTPVVIMAGGFGKRLDPFTRILPKALIPVGEKPVIELIMERFIDQGLDHFFISVNHKARMVRAYFEDFEKPYKIKFMEEEAPLGTVGSLSILKQHMNKTFILSNCDVLVQADYRDMLEFHRKEKSQLTIIASVLHHTVPYGICQLRNKVELDIFKEKPVYDFLVNTGMYLIDPSVLSHIPENRRMDMPQLINRLKKDHQKIAVYPVSEGSWLDVGQWESYQQSIKRMSV